MEKGIYCIEHISTGRKYFGSSFNMPKRLRDHRRTLSKGTHHNVQLQRAVDKYGIDEFKFYMIEELPDLSRKDLLIIEQSYIDQNQAGYNMAPANGGDIISKHPNREDIISKIAQSVRLRYAHMTKEERQNKHGRSGPDNYNWRGSPGRKLCPVCKATEISICHNTCTNCRNRAGEKNPFYNKHHSVETKQKLREANSGPNSWIKGIDPSKLPYTKQYMITYADGSSKTVYGLKTISEEFGVTVENIHATLKRIADGKFPKRGKMANVIITEVTKGPK